MLWQWISRILEWLKEFVNSKIKQDWEQRKQIEEIDKRLKDMETEVRERYEQNKKDLPDDGDAMVEYWRTRGVPPKDSDRS